MAIFGLPVAALGGPEPDGGPPAGLRLWLRADAGVERDVGSLVGRWRDQSGSGLDFTQLDGSRMPRFESVALGGRPALRFDGNDLLTRADGMVLGSYTKVAVVRLDDYAANNNVLSGSTVHALWFGQSDRAQIYHAGSFVVSDTPALLDRTTVLVATHDATTGVGTLYQDGRRVGTGVAAANTDPTLQVGAYAFGNFFVGSIAELMLFDRVLPTNELARVGRYLSGKYLGEFPEVELTAAPRDGELIPRALDTDQGTVTLAGRVNSPGYPSIELEVLRDGQPWKTVEQSLDYVGGAASFEIQTTLDAGLVDYDLVLRLVDGVDTRVVTERRDVVCGDVLLLQGQSNTVALDYHSEGLGNQSQSSWIRSFGTGTLFGNDVPLDLHWGLADGELGNAHAAIGSWGLRMAELLVERHQVPIAVVNGSVGGTAISLHQRNDANPTDLGSIYGRLLYRVREAGPEVAQRARAMLWYQGESDGGLGGAYPASFAALRSDWLQDYPGLEQIYLFQIRQGCFIPNSDVREVLRTLPDVHPDVSVMSTTAAPGHDSCHFFYAGYRELGERMERMVSRDLYGAPDEPNVDPPNVSSVRALAPDRLEVRFRDPDDPLVFDPGAELHFTLDDGSRVVSGTADGARLLLDLDGPSQATTLSYWGHWLDGPWVTNGAGVGALTFFDFPIER